MSVALAGGTGAARRLAIPLPPSPPHRRRHRHLVAQPRAALYSLPSDLYGSLQTGCGIAFLLALGFSALPILTGDAAERNERRFLQPSDEDSTENIRWSVMGVLSLLPFVNPMAWVFAALDDEDTSTLYYSFAFIYALPYLANGFQLDGFVLVSLVLCAVHVQVERLAQTEPVEVELPSVLRSLLAGIPKAVRSLGRYSSRLGDEVGGRTRSSSDAAKRRPDRKYLEERSREARAELEAFDRRRRERQQVQQREQQREQLREKERER
ncbi:Ras-related Rab7 [Micractinium conductrix]|uniref:Ras-related Rab7 n=1 Tax=Micractinium conductrix TaxID=554055 RepID=A0A2P6V9Y1_9CHLO|nr:Ras-related Rab7 [Micractinium conductrix]|eukprot:PSC70899.1 Ras-related Rab7 [Micractinium conductrix]